MDDLVNTDPRLRNMQSTNQPDALQQMLAAKLTLRQELRFDFRCATNENQVIIEDPIRAKFFQIGLAEFKLVSSFDGQCSLEEILQRGDLHSDKSSVLSVDQSIKVVQWLLQNNLGYVAASDNLQRIEDQAKHSARAKMLGLLNPLSFKLPLFNPNRLLRSLGVLASVLFSVWFLLVWLAVGGFAASILFSDWQRIGLSSLQVFSGFRWLWLLLAWIGLKAIHELAHGLACRKFGGEVPEAGLLFILFTPMAYVNVTSMWRLSNRWERILISSAGIYVELFLSFVALILWHYAPGFWGDIGFNIFVMASLNTVMFNANPLMRFDGYFILSDLLQIPNLYSKSMRWLGDRFKNLVFGTPVSAGLLKPGESPIVPIYGILAWCWKITIGISLLIAASVLFQGAGILLTAVGVVLWYAIPAWKHWKWFTKAKQNREIQMPRLVASSAIAVAILYGMFVLFAAPATKSAPALVQFSGEQLLRAGNDGFVKELLVETGQRVVAGQPLIVLSSPELELSLVELEKRIQESVILNRIKTMNGELAMAQAESETAESLRQQRSEKEALKAALVLKAPADGIVFRRGLEHQIGRYVRAGEELLTFAQSSTKEIVVAVDQRDWDSIKECEGKPIRILFPGHAITSGILRRIVPKASLNPLHPSLMATNGGPLAVKPKAENPREREPDSSMELLAPRFAIELELNPKDSEALSAGQRGHAFFDAKRQSMGSYLYLAIADWFEEKAEIASQTAAF